MSNQSNYLKAITALRNMCRIPKEFERHARNLRVQEILSLLEEEKDYLQRIRNHVAITQEENATISAIVSALELIEYKYEI